MISDSGQKGRPRGESAPLIPRDHSAILLHGDKHILARKASSGSNRSGNSQQQKRTTSNHKRTWSDWTFLTGNLTKFGSESEARHDQQHDQQRARRRQWKFMTKLLIWSCFVLAFLYTCTILIGPLVLSFQDESEWCSQDGRKLKVSGDSSSTAYSWEMNVEDKEYENPDYITDPCWYVRVPQLGWLTLEECDLSRRMLTSVILGGAIGYERRTSDRPAGIRTMGLVSLGACFFTISSIMAFKSSTMGWDASRVTAALPTGVGFLGAALIWKGSVTEGDQEQHQVHGLTTAASLWLSAAIGVGAGGALYVVSIYSTVLILLVLRYGPKFFGLEDDEFDEDVEEEVEENEAQDDAKEHSFHKEEDLHSMEDSMHTRESVFTRDSLRESRPERRVVFEAGFPQSLTTDDAPPLSVFQSQTSSFSFVRQAVEGSITTPPQAMRRRRSSIHVNRPTFHG